MIGEEILWNNRSLRWRPHFSGINPVLGHVHIPTDADP